MMTGGYRPSQILVNLPIIPTICQNENLSNHQTDSVRIGEIWTGDPLLTHGTGATHGTGVALRRSGRHGHLFISLQTTGEQNGRDGATKPGAPGPGLRGIPNWTVESMDQESDHDFTSWVMMVNEYPTMMVHFLFSIQL